MLNIGHDMLYEYIINPLKYAKAAKLKAEIKGLQTLIKDKELELKSLSA
jgi:hypothetical protein